MIWVVVEFRIPPFPTTAASLEAAAAPPPPYPTIAARVVAAELLPTTDSVEVHVEQVSGVNLASPAVVEEEPCPQ